MTRRITLPTSIVRPRGEKVRRELLAEETRKVIEEYLGLPEMHFLEACVDCGACAPSCPFYKAVDKRYSPVGMANEMRKLYKKTSTITGRLLGRLVGAKLPETEEEIEEIFDLAYHCSNCGACYYTCPHGIDSGTLIAMLRSVLFRHGLAPSIINLLARLELRVIESPWRSLQYEWDRVIEELKRDHNVAKEGEGRYLILLDIYNVFVNKENIDAYLEVLDAANIKYSFPDRPLGVRPPLPLTVGHYETARRIANFIYNYTTSKGYRNLLILDGGYPYNDLKFAYTYYRASKPQELEITHVAQLIYESYLYEGLPAFTQWGKATYIPSCNIDTRGGIGAASKLVEITARPYEKHLMWPYAGVGWMSLLCPYVREKLSIYLGVDLVLEEESVEEKLVSDMRKVARHLAEEAYKTSTGYHVFGCIDDIIVMRAARVENVNPVHLAQWLKQHLLK
ncbi:MAG: (Fe-S)-binding protein [Desulfurococcales archaeon]|nr:(Fe-S)-binding protein [Desulfurococcales archaeon]